MMAGGFEEVSAEDIASDVNGLEFYGREETNYYSDGKRLGLYKVYAPIQKNKLQNILTSGLPRGLKFFCQKKQKRRLNDGQTAKPNRRILWRESS